MKKLVFLAPMCVFRSQNRTVETMVTKKKEGAANPKFSAGKPKLKQRNTTQIKNC